MTAQRRLVVNADDFGISAGVNRGVIEAHEHGIVTSASLMTRWPAAADAARYARSYPQLGIGLHVDLGEWIYQQDEWRPLYHVVSDDPQAVRQEILRQLETFRQLVGRDPDHLNSHQHVHRSEPALSVMRALSDELRVPLRHFTPDFQYCGDFYGQSDTGESFPDLISAESLIRILRDLPPGGSELCCHPAAQVDLVTMYGRERVMELRSLCDPRVRQTLQDENISLTKFTGSKKGFLVRSSPAPAPPTAAPRAGGGT
jgi:predicted glycoside hydrolase/deacetylase ChbG (UPF0249 family)